MRRPFVPVLLAPLLLPLLAGVAPRAEGGRAALDLSGALEAAVRRSSVAPDRCGIAVLEVGETLRVVYARGHTRALPTASVAKVLTSAAALDLLGPGHVFATRVTARGTLGDDGTLRGDLVVHGSGDPNLSGRFYAGAATHVLDRLAAGVREAGIRRVEGDLVLDDGPFDREYAHPDWSAADRERWYGAPVGGLAFNDSCLSVLVRGGARPGAPAALEVPSTPGPWRVENRATTVPSGKVEAWARWEPAEGVLAVQGKAPLKGSYLLEVPVPEPVAFFGGAFARSLAAAGVQVRGSMRLAASAEDRLPGREVASHASSLASTLRVMNRRSQNFYAGCVFKAAGAALDGEGSWESGRRAVAETLRRRRIPDDGHTVVVDGSGLSLRNEASAGAIALLLAQMRRDVLRGPVLLDSLAVPGEEGTLDDRLLGADVRARLHAKTGTLARSGVHALAGYLEARGGGPTYAFAILVRSGTGARELIDGLVTELARP